MAWNAHLPSTALRLWRVRAEELIAEAEAVPLKRGQRTKGNQADIDTQRAMVKCIEQELQRRETAGE